METKPRSLKRISPAALKSMMDNGKKLTFIDVRDEQPWVDSGLKSAGAMRVRLSEWEQHLSENSNSHSIMTCCT